MPGCVLRLSGLYSQLSATIESSSIPLVEAIASKRRRETSRDWATFNFTVSDAEDVATQIQDAEWFLTSHSAEILELCSKDETEMAVFDFGWEIPSDSLRPSIRFPATLLKKCGDLGIEIQVSIYPTTPESDD